MPSRSALFASALICCLWTCVGSYFFFDLPGSIGIGPTGTIQSRFVAANKTYTVESNQLLYSVYSWPNTVLAFFGGALTDKFGLRRSLIAYSSLVVVGSVVFLGGLWATELWLMIVGRVVFGLGGECLSVAQKAAVNRWFKQTPWLAAALGIAVSCSRVGTALVFLVAPIVADNRGAEWSALLCVGVCVASWIAAGVFIAVDRMGENGGHVPETKPATSLVLFSVEKFKSFSSIFWLLTLVCILCYGAQNVLFTFARNYFVATRGVDPNTASRYIFLYQGLCALALPLVSVLVDKTGRISFWLIEAAAALTLTHVFLSFTSAPLGFVMPFMAVFGYSAFVASVWPAGSLVSTAPGLAFGILKSIQNIGLAALPLVTGALADHYSYTTADESLLACGCVSVAAAVLLCVADYSCDVPLLFMSATQRKEWSIDAAKAAVAPVTTTPTSGARGQPSSMEADQRVDAVAIVLLPPGRVAVRAPAGGSRAAINSAADESGESRRSAKNVADSLSTEIVYVSSCSFVAD